MRRHKPADGSRCSEVSTTMELHRLQEESVSWGELAVEFWMEYADALAEAGSGKTCAVDVQAADLSCRFGELCVGRPKKP